VEESLLLGPDGFDRTALVLFLEPGRFGSTDQDNTEVRRQNIRYREAFARIYDEDWVVVDPSAKGDVTCVLRLEVRSNQERCGS